MFFEYKVLIVYRDFTKEYIRHEFSIFAKDEENANKIAKEILYLKGGTPTEDLQFVVKAVSPNKELYCKYQQIIKPLYIKLVNLYKDKDYSYFIDMFIKLSGYGAKFDRKHKIKEYVSRYEEIDVRVLFDFEENTCKLDDNYIILYYNDSTYFVTDNMNTIINCKV